MVKPSNPWVTTTPATETDRSVSAASDDVPGIDNGVEAWQGVGAPQPGVPAPDQADRLGRVAVTDGDALHVIGAHGGAGESVMAAWLHGKATQHRWPILDSGSRARVVLVARTSSAGMAAARKAATEWASGQAPADLVGLVLIDDAPGRLPRELHAEAKHLSGGVPRTWRMPYVPALRFAAEPTQIVPAGRARRVIHAINTHITTTPRSTS